MTCEYMGWCYRISRIDEKLGLVYLKLGNHEIPVRKTDCSNIK